MLKYIDSAGMGRGRHGWLDSHFHFSFADYYNPRNMQFGVLRVVNDDIVQPSYGFDTHPHRNMEILSYVIEGELTHADSLQSLHTLKRGEVQYMSAGSGILHSEYNRGSVPLRFLQIWILPERQGTPPDYGDFRFRWEDRVNRWLPIAARIGNETSKAPIRVHADVNVSATFLQDGQSLGFEVGTGRQAYLVLIEGEADINGQSLGTRDAMEIVEENILVSPRDRAHLLVIEMEKS